MTNNHLITTKMHKQAHSERLTSTPPIKRKQYHSNAELYQHIKTKLTDTDREVCRILADHFGIDISEMFEVNRKQDIVRARQLFRLWLTTKTTRSLKHIGAMTRIVPTDHATVIHSANTARDMINTDYDSRNAWDLIKHINPPKPIIPSLPIDPAWVKTKVDNRHLIAQFNAHK